MYCKNRIKKFLPNITAWCIILAIFASYVLIDYKLKNSLNYDYRKTNEYLKTVSWEKYINHANELMIDYKSTRINYQDPDNPDIVNLQIIEQLEKKLDGISRKKVLQKLFRGENAKSFDKDLVLQNLVNNLQEVLYHDPKIQPLYRDGTIVTDPLILLELGIGRCGHSARIAVDLFSAADYPARYIQMAHDIQAEIYWNGKWHFLQTDITADIHFKQIYGFWPSFEDLSENFQIVDRYPMVDWGNLISGESSLYRNYNYNSYWYFGGDTKEDQLGYWLKIIPKNEWQNDKYYGWQRLNKEPYQRVKVNKSYLPQIPSASIEIQEDRQLISFSEPKDLDHDFWRYEICLHNQSRGWDYGQSTYDIARTLQSIDCNVGTFHSHGEPLEIDFNQGKYYFSVYAKDKRAIEDPKIFYPPSQEYSFEVL